MKRDIPEIMYERLSILLDADNVDRDNAIKSFALSQEDETTLRSLLQEATSTSIFDAGIGALFPSLTGNKPPELDGFEIIREIGRGGMGVVYLAEDTELKRYVALKFIRNGISHYDNTRLLEEARTVARLDHHGIVHVHQLGRYDDGVFIASAYIEGETLWDSIERVREKNGIALSSGTPLPRSSPANSRLRIDKALGIIRDVASAMDYSHRRGVFHRDLKPSNILLDEGGVPFVIDFGIAGSADESLRTGGPIGTLQYMSPEQAGAIQTPVAAPSDVYALGIILFELLTLRRPYQVSTLAELLRWFDKHESVDPRRLNPAIPDAIAAICKRATDVSPDKRYPDAGALMTDLDRALAGTLAPPGLTFSRVAHALRSHPVITGCVLTAVVIGGGSGVLAMLPDRTPPGSIRFLQGPVDVVSVRLFDPRSRLPGDSILDSTNIRSLTLPPGRYRLTVQAGLDIYELTRQVISGERLDIDPLLHAVDLNTGDMALIQGGTYLIGYDDSPIPEMKPYVADVEPFLIDKYEVTNAEYLAFVTDTGHAPPRHWLIPYSPSLDPLPVVGVSQFDARAYAEWIGKRLPTDAEWEIAASGDSRSRFPWGDTPVDVSSVQLGAVNNASAMSSHGDAATVDAYHGGVHPCRAGIDVIDRTSAGVFHLAGNVAEWTDSVLTPLGTASGAILGIVKGNSFMMSESALLSNQQATLQGANAATLGTGFRCAASIVDIEQR